MARHALTSPTRPWPRWARAVWRAGDGHPMLTGVRTDRRPVSRSCCSPA